MPKISSLEPFLLWREFAAICAEIHPSGHEHALRAKLVKRAREAGLAAAVDAAGNLRIDRPAAPECEKRPAIILQAHLDMVPQADDATGFDFRKTPVTPVIAGDFVTAAGTTLGADNGIGLAAALALIFDPGLRAGPLALLATVEEETSMRGAFLAEPEMLRGDILFNLDSETEGELCCGCAGGCRLTLRLNVPTVPAPPGGRAVKISLSGLKGGHSGMDIDKNRGNAVTMLAGFAARLDAFAVADFRGGSLDNAIPRESAVTGVARQSLAELRKSAGRFSAKARKPSMLSSEP